MRHQGDRLEDRVPETERAPSPSREMPPAAARSGRVQTVAEVGFRPARDETRVELRIVRFLEEDVRGDAARREPGELPHRERRQLGGQEDAALSLLQSPRSPRPHGLPAARTASTPPPRQREPARRRVLAGDEKQAPVALGEKHLRLRRDLPRAEHAAPGRAEGAAEAAVEAVVDADVRVVERREQPDAAAEVELAATESGRRQLLVELQVDGKRKKQRQIPKRQLAEGTRRASPPRAAPRRLFRGRPALPDRPRRAFQPLARCHGGGVYRPAALRPSGLDRSGQRHPLDPS